jgi:CheY-like chemotaxis protein
MSKKILVVDDDNLVCQSLAQALTQVGYSVEVASNGKQGLEKALASHPDLVLADVRMPEMDGLTMIEKMRQDAWGRTVPVVMLSTDESTGSINQALVSGVTVYMSKSGSTPDAVAKAISSALGQ